MYEKGYPDLKQNYELAFNHYYDACNHQIPEAFIHLGNMYKNVLSLLRRDVTCGRTNQKQSNISRKQREVGRKTSTSCHQVVSSSIPVTSGPENDRYYLRSYPFSNTIASSKCDFLC